MTKRSALHQNDYPLHTTLRHLHSCLRDESGYIVRPVLSADKKKAIKYELLGVKDLPEIHPDKTGRRAMRNSVLRQMGNVINDDWNGEIFKYCTHCEDQILLPLSHYTSNKAGYAACLLTEEDAERYHIKGHSTQPFCKECKRRYVNASGNPKRTSEQHIESSAIARLRSILPSPLKDDKISLEDVFAKYGHACFKCGIDLDRFARDSYEIDHTLPASLFWPLTGDNCTLLCNNCNQEKSDLWPRYYYSRAQIRILATLTGFEEGVLGGDRCLNPTAIAFFSDALTFDKRITECYRGTHSRRKDKNKIRQRYDASFKNLIDKVKKVCDNRDSKVILGILENNGNTKHLLTRKGKN